LLPVEPGKCTFETTEPRAPLALLESQRFRIYQEVNNLRLIDAELTPHPLTMEQRDMVVDALEEKQKLTFAGIRRILKLSRAWEFNLEGEVRKDLRGNQSSIALGHQKCLGRAWSDLSLDKQAQLVKELLTASSDDDLIQILTDNYGLTADQAIAAAQVSLPQGYGNLSLKAIDKIHPHLQADVVTYDKAALAAGYNHSMLYDGVIHEELPYYGEVLERYTAGASNDPADTDERRWGKIANPTVHVGLNQVRKVVNALMKRYGPPYEVVIEVTRELKLNQVQKKRIRKEPTKPFQIRQENTIGMGFYYGPQDCLETNVGVLARTQWTD
jgi:CRISPR-associated endonuclease Csn1